MPSLHFCTANQVLVILCHSHIGMLVSCFQATQSTTVQQQRVSHLHPNLFYSILRGLMHFVHLQ